VDRLAIVVICNGTDLGALRVHDRLRRSGAPAVLVTADELCLAPWWRHEPGIGTEIILGNGLRLTDAVIGAVFNRLDAVDPPQFLLGRPDGREYAQAEMHALLLSWLETLGQRVINRPSAMLLAGMRLTRVEERLALHRSGMATARMAVATSARRLPANDMSARAYCPDDPYATPTETSVAALAGGPIMLEPRGGRERRAVVVGNWSRPDSMPEQIRAQAIEIMRDRGIAVGELQMWQANHSITFVRAIDCMPALGHDEEVEAVSQLLIMTAAQVPSVR